MWNLRTRDLLEAKLGKEPLSRGGEEKCRFEIATLRDLQRGLREQMSQSLTLRERTDDDRPQQGAIRIEFNRRCTDYATAVVRNDRRRQLSIHAVHRQMRRLKQLPHGRQISLRCRIDRHGSVTARGAQQDPPVAVGRT